MFDRYFLVVTSIYWLLVQESQTDTRMKKKKKNGCCGVRTHALSDQCLKLAPWTTRPNNLTITASNNGTGSASLIKWQDTSKRSYDRNLSATEFYSHQFSHYLSGEKRIFLCSKHTFWISRHQIRVTKIRRYRINNIMSSSDLKLSTALYSLFAYWLALQ